VAWAVVGREEIDGLNVALNEATWIDVRVDVAGCRVDFALHVLALAAPGELRAAEQVIVSLGQVRRVAASYRHGRWDDLDAAVEPLRPEDLSAVVRGFGGCPIYGWEFLDPPEHSWVHWQGRLSMDLALPGSRPAHVLDVSLEGGAPARHLDLRVWFTDLCITAADAQPIALADFIAAGVRWWDGLYARDPRTSGKGIFPD
jgi:hypothetical protein